MIKLGIFLPNIKPFTSLLLDQTIGTIKPFNYLGFKINLLDIFNLDIKLLLFNVGMTLFVYGINKSVILHVCSS